MNKMVFLRGKCNKLNKIIQLTSDVSCVPKLVFNSSDGSVVESEFSRNR